MLADKFYHIWWGLQFAIGKVNLNLPPLFIDKKGWWMFYLLDRLIYKNLILKMIWHWKNPVGYWVVAVTIFSKIFFPRRLGKLSMYTSLFSVFRILVNQYKSNISYLLDVEFWKNNYITILTFKRFCLCQVAQNVLLT